MKSKMALTCCFSKAAPKTLGWIRISNPAIPQRLRFCYCRLSLVSSLLSSHWWWIQTFFRQASEKILIVSVSGQYELLIDAPNRIQWNLPFEWQPCSALATVPCLLTPSCQALISWWCVWQGCRRLKLVWHWFSLPLALAPSSGTAVDEMPGPLLADVSMWLQHVGLE